MLMFYVYILFGILIGLTESYRSSFTRVSSSSHLFVSELLRKSFHRPSGFRSFHENLKMVSTSEENEKVKDTGIATVIPASKQSIKKSEFKALLKALFKTYWLVLGEILVILAARWNPQFGRTGGILHPEITISKIAVPFIFFMNGLFLSPSSAPEQRDTGNKFNIMIQLFNYGFIPLFTKALVPLFPHKSLVDGLLVLSCIPTTMSICISQTQAAGGDLTTAIFNAVFSNAIGVFVTPLLAVCLVGAGGGVSLLSTLVKLGEIVILPMIVGQLLRRTSFLSFAEQFRKYTRELGSFLLLSIVYNTFCDTFITGFGISNAALSALLYTAPIANIFFLVLFWNASKVMLPSMSAKTRAAGLFCATQKTLTFGIPFIKTAFGHRSDLSSILAPLLMYAPAQLILGSSLVVPLMQKEIEKEDIYEAGGGI